MKQVSVVNTPQSVPGRRLAVRDHASDRDLPSHVGAPCRIGPPGSIVRWRHAAVDGTASAGDR